MANPLVKFTVDNQFFLFPNIVFILYFKVVRDRGCVIRISYCRPAFLRFFSFLGGFRLVSELFGDICSSTRDRRAPLPQMVSPPTPPNLGEKHFPFVLPIPFLPSFPPPSFLLSFPLSFLPCLLPSNPYQLHITRGFATIAIKQPLTFVFLVNPYCFHIESSKALYLFIQPL